jgi:ADP-heptose:LPS heptosyltransferase
VTLREGARVLALRALGLGDLLTVVPALRAVRRHWPAAEVVLACPPSLWPLVRLVGAVDSLVAVRGLDDALDWAELGSIGPDVAVNLHGRGPQSHLMLASARPRWLLGHACADAGWTDGPPWDADVHEVVRWCRLLEWYGIAADPSDLRLDRPARPSPAPGAVVVHPGAAAESRRWPVDRFAGVARALAEAGLAVVVTGGVAEMDRAHAVAARAGLSPERVLAGRTGLTALAALVADARLVVCGDTGVGHLATAYGTRSVHLFGPAPPAQWGPPADRPRHRVLWHGRSGNPHGSTPDPGLLAITQDEVLSAAWDLLGGFARFAPLRAARH